MVLLVNTKSLLHLAVPTDVDVPALEEGNNYSFVTSDHYVALYTGYFMPKYKEYMYRVTCANASSCTFEKINTGYRNPAYPVTMAIQPDSGLKFICLSPVN